MYAHSPLQAIEKDLRIALNHLWNSGEKLRSEKLQKQTVLDAIDDAIIITDPDYSILYTNSRLNYYFGHHTDWVSGHIESFNQYLGKQTTPEGVNQYQHLYSQVQQSDSHHGHCEIVLHSPQKRNLRLFTGPIQNKKSQHLGRIWKFEDLTAEKELEEAKTEFVSLASHQLRTPVTTIYGYLQMLKDGTYGEIPDQIIEPITSLVHSASQMRDLVNDLLDISRVDSGKIVAQQKPVRILDLAKDVAQSFSRQLLSKNLKLLMFPKHLDIEINTDPKLAGEMLRNLLDNAIKYSHKFGRIWIELDKVAGGIQLSVKDEGLGIPPDQQHRMFEKFFRASNAVKQDVDGTGLGLYYVKKCAQSLDARLGFQSVENKGSTFWFVLPEK